MSFEYLNEIYWLKSVSLYHYFKDKMIENKIELEKKMMFVILD